MTNISGASVSCRMQLTTMSCSARTSTSGAARGGRGRACAPGARGRGRTAASAPRRSGASTADTARWVRTDTSPTPSADSALHRAARGGAEADHRGAQRAAVVAADPEQREGVQDRAVARQLVVLVEDVETKSPSLAPVVHRLPGDEGHAPVDGELGHLAVLDAVRPAPDDLPGAQRLEVLGQRLGQQEHVALREELLARAQPADQRPDLLVARTRAGRRSRARRTSGARRSASMRSRCAGWIACRRSSGLRDVATTPRVRSGHGTSLWAACGASQRRTASSREGSPPPRPGRAAPAGSLC